VSCSIGGITVPLCGNCRERHGTEVALPPVGATITKRAARLREFRFAARLMLDPAHPVTLALARALPTPPRSGEKCPHA
jgi:hypothetical protein